MRSLKKYIYPTLSDRVYEILGENYFLILYPVLLFFIIAEKYLNIIIKILIKEETKKVE